MLPPAETRGFVFDENRAVGFYFCYFYSSARMQCYQFKVDLINNPFIYLVAVVFVVLI